MSETVPSLFVAADRSGTSLSFRMPRTAFEHAGFREFALSEEMPEGACATFVDGEVFVFMSPESLETHNKPKTAITVGLAGIVAADELGELYGDGTLLTNMGAQLSTEPDLLFVSWATLESGRVTLTSREGRDDEYIELVGAPDLVVEVVSDSSVRKDLVRLREAYHRAGIAEYWLVDARGAEVNLTILAHKPDGYEPAAAEGAPQPSVVLGRTFRLERSRNRVQRWAYRLIG